MNGIYLYFVNKHPSSWPILGLQGSLNFYFPVFIDQGHESSTEFALLLSFVCPSLCLSVQNLTWNSTFPFIFETCILQGNLCSSGKEIIRITQLGVFTSNELAWHTVPHIDCLLNCQGNRLCSRWNLSFCLSDWRSLSSHNPSRLSPLGGIL